jgi:hypothetical protein
MEKAGLPTLVLSVMPDITASTGAPRVAGVGYPQGQPFGPPGDADGQRAVLQAALDAFERITEPGGRLDLDFAGPPRRQRLHPQEPPPIVKLLRRRPWLLPRLVAGDIPE